MSDYKLTSAFDAAQRERASELLAWSAREQWTTNALQTRLQREGLGYRRQNLIEDYHHAQVVSASKTPEARERAEHFYDNVYLPFKEEHDLSAAQMGEVMSAFKRETEAPDELAELLNEWGEWTEETGT